MTADRRTDEHREAVAMAGTARATTSHPAIGKNGQAECSAIPPKKPAIARTARPESVSKRISIFYR
jgi:hypothetical protein